LGDNLVHDERALPLRNAIVDKNILPTVTFTTIDNRASGALIIPGMLDSSPLGKAIQRHNGRCKQFSTMLSLDHDRMPSSLRKQKGGLAEIETMARNYLDEQGLLIIYLVLSGEFDHAQAVSTVSSQICDAVIKLYKIISDGGNNCTTYAATPSGRVAIIHLGPSIEQIEASPGKKAAMELIRHICAPFGSVPYLEGNRTLGHLADQFLATRGVRTKIEAWLGIYEEKLSMVERYAPAMHQAAQDLRAQGRLPFTPIGQTVSGFAPKAKPASGKGPAGNYGKTSRSVAASSGVGAEAVEILRHNDYAVSKTLSELSRRGIKRRSTETVIDFFGRIGIRGLFQERFVDANRNLSGSVPKLRARFGLGKLQARAFKTEFVPKPTRREIRELCEKECKWDAGKISAALEIYVCVQGEIVEKLNALGYVDIFSKKLKEVYAAKARSVDATAKFFRVGWPAVEGWLDNPLLSVFSPKPEREELVSVLEKRYYWNFVKALPYLKKLGRGTDALEILQRIGYADILFDRIRIVYRESGYDVEQTGRALGFSGDTEKIKDKTRSYLVHLREFTAETSGKEAVYVTDGAISTLFIKHHWAVEDACQIRCGSDQNVSIHLQKTQKGIQGAPQ